MGAPLETFAACSNENVRSVSVICAALRTAFGTQEECTLLDYGAEDGRFMSDIVQNSGLSCNVIGTDINDAGLDKAQRNYKKAGAENTHVARIDIVGQDIHSMRYALGWSDGPGDVGAPPGADMLLASHIGYYLPLSMQLLSVGKMAQLTAPEGMMVFVHSNGDSQFDTLRAEMGKEINKSQNAQRLTHTRLQNEMGNLQMPHFEVRLPCGLHLPNDEAALRAAWFGEGKEALTEEGQKNLELLENVISFIGGKKETAMGQLREELGTEELRRIWDEFWQARLEESKGQDELCVSVAGGKMIFAFHRGQEPRAEQVRDVVDAYCRENGFGNDIVSEVRTRAISAEKSGRGW